MFSWIDIDCYVWTSNMSGNKLKCFFYETLLQCSENSFKQTNIDSSTNLILLSDIFHQTSLNNLYSVKQNVQYICIIYNAIWMSLKFHEENIYWLSNTISSESYWRKNEFYNTKANFLGIREKCISKNPTVSRWSTFNIYVYRRFHEIDVAFSSNKNIHSERRLEFTASIMRLLRNIN